MYKNLTYSLNIYLWLFEYVYICVYYVLGTVLDIGDTVVKNTYKFPALMEFIL